MEAGNEDIEMLKALIQKSFSEQRDLITRLETALDAMTSFNGKQMLDSRDMRLQQAALFQAERQDILLGFRCIPVPP